MCRLADWQSGERAFPILERAEHPLARLARNRLEGQANPRRPRPRRETWQKRVSTSGSVAHSPLQR